MRSLQELSATSSTEQQTRRRHFARDATRSGPLHQPRPVRLLNDRLTPLVNRKTTDIDFVVFRENTEGAYCGAGGF